MSHLFFGGASAKICDYPSEPAKRDELPEEVLWRRIRYQFHRLERPIIMQLHELRRSQSGLDAVEYISLQMIE